MKYRSASWFPVLLAAAGLLLAGCDSSTTAVKTSSSGTTLGAPTTSMAFPASVTGGPAPASATLQGAGLVPQAAGGPNCNVAGETGDPMANGHRMTRFMVGIVAPWPCLADFIMSTVEQMVAGGQVKPDGTFYPLAGPPPAPTGVSVSIDSATGIRTVKMFFNSDATTPGLYLAWVAQTGGSRGKVVIKISAMLPAADPKAPTDLRMDFQNDGTTKSGDMFMAFAATSPMLNGFRVQASQTLADKSLVIKGLMDTKAQFNATTFPTPPYPAPQLAMIAVTDGAGNGAALASMINVAAFFGPLGNFLFTKTDKHYFDLSSNPQWINKAITAAAYKGGANLVAPNPTPAMVDTMFTPALTPNTTADCTASSQTSTSAANCLILLGRLFAQPPSGLPPVEANSATAEPTDARNAGINNGTLLTSVYPTGSTSWTGVFDMTFQ